MKWLLSRDLLIASSLSNICCDSCLTGHSCHNVNRHIQDMGQYQASISDMSGGDDCGY